MNESSILTTTEAVLEFPALSVAEIIIVLAPAVAPGVLALKVKLPSETSVIAVPLQVNDGEPLAKPEVASVAV